MNHGSYTTNVEHNLRTNIQWRISFFQPSPDSLINIGSLKFKECYLMLLTVHAYCRRETLKQWPFVQLQTHELRGSTISLEHLPFLATVTQRKYTNLVLDCLEFIDIRRSFSS